MSEDPCEVCGIVPGESLTPAAYEVLWEAVPDLRDAQDLGTSVYCPECGRQLTFAEGLPVNLEDVEKGTA